MHHSERNRFLDKDLRDFLTKDWNDLIDLVVCCLHDSLVDAIFFLFVNKCPCCRGPVTGILLHADEERHMLRPDRSQHDAEQAYYQDRMIRSGSISPTPQPSPAGKFANRKPVQKIKNTFHSSGTASGIVEIMKV